MARAVMTQRVHACTEVRAVGNAPQSGQREGGGDGQCGRPQDWREGGASRLHADGPRCHMQGLRWEAGWRQPQGSRRPAALLLAWLQV